MMPIGVAFDRMNAFGASFHQRLDLSSKGVRLEIGILAT